MLTSSPLLASQRLAVLSGRENSCNLRDALFEEWIIESHSLRGGDSVRGLGPGPQKRRGGPGDTWPLASR